MHRETPSPLRLPLAVLLGLAVIASLVVPAAAMVQVGQSAPDFVLTDFGGSTHTLSDYRGKVVVLAFVGYS